VKNVFIRGSVVRYVVLPPEAVDRGLLEDATRRGESPTAHPLPHMSRWTNIDILNVLQKLRTRLAKPNDVSYYVLDERLAM
jgi:hypothetical protein